jgi:hypothetical protein
MWAKICEIYSPMAEKKRDNSNWKTEVGKIQKCNQRQDSTVDQLRDLILVADKLGFYDASDYIKEIVNN